MTAKTIISIAAVSAVTSVIGGAINKGWAGVANAGKIMLGNFYLVCGDALLLVNP